MREKNRRVLSALLFCCVVFLSSSVLAAPFAYVSHKADNAVSVIDLATSAVIDTIPVGEAPFSLTPSPDGRWMFSVNDDGTVSKIDVATNQVASTITLGVEFPRVAAITPDGNFLYVTYGFDLPRGVVEVNLNTNSLSLIEIDGFPGAIAISPDGNSVIVASSPISVIDRSNGNAVTQYDIGAPSAGVLFNPNTSQYYFTNDDGGPPWMGLGPDRQTVTVMDFDPVAKTLSFVKTIAVGALPRFMQLSPDTTMLYVANGVDQTFSIIDTATLNVVDTISTQGPLTSMKITSDGSKFYIPRFSENKVSIFDIASETIIAEISVGNGPKSIRIVPGYDPQSISEVGIIGMTPGEAWHLTIDGNIAYVTNGENGLQLVDISNPSTPALRGNITVPGGWTRGIDVNGMFAYVGDGPNGLLVVDVSNPDFPVLTGSVKTLSDPVDWINGAWGVEFSVLNSLVYVADGAGLQIVDVADSANPVLLGRIETPGPATDVKLVGNYAYVADGPEGLRVIDISDPFNLIEVGSLATPGVAWRVDVVGSIAYLTNGDSGLRLIDVSNPTNPVEVNYVETPGWASYISVKWPFAYVTVGNFGMQVIDVIWPETAKAIASFETPGNASGVEVAEGFAFVADEASLRVADISAIKPDLSNDKTLIERTFVNVLPTTEQVTIDVTEGETYTWEATGLIPGTLTMDIDSFTTIHGGTYDLWAYSTENWQLTATDNSVYSGKSYTVHNRQTGQNWAELTGDINGIATLADNQIEITFFDVNGIPVTGTNSLSFASSTPPLNGSSTATTLVIFNSTQTGVASGYYNGTFDMTSASVFAQGFDTGMMLVSYTNPVTGESGDSYAFTDRQYTSNAIIGHGMGTGPLDGSFHFIQQGRPVAGTVTTTIVEHAVENLGLNPTADEDGDGVNNATDQCVYDPGKVYPGSCGCGVVDIDSDGDVVMDCNDACPADPTKISPGINGCGVPDPIPVLPSLMEIGAIGTQPGQAWRLKIDGNIAYVTNGESGLQLIDIADPSAPVLRGNINIPDGDTRGIDVDSSFAYVGDGSNGLLVVDISNPDLPILAGSVKTLNDPVNPSAGAWGVDYSDLTSRVYVADEAGMQIVDVANPANPILLGRIETLGNAFDVKNVGDYAYVADGEQGLRIIDVTDPTIPTEVGHIDSPGVAWEIDVVGHIVYLTEGDAGLRLIDVSDPTSPIVVNHIETPGWASGVTVQWPFAYVADENFGMQVIDVTWPETAKAIAHFETPGRAYDADFANGFAFVADDSSLRIVDLAGLKPDIPEDMTLLEREILSNQNTPEQVDITIVEGDTYTFDVTGILPGKSVMEVENFTIINGGSYDQWAYSTENWQLSANNGSEYYGKSYTVHDRQAGHQWSVLTGDVEAVSSTINGQYEASIIEIKGTPVSGKNFMTITGSTPPTSSVDYPNVTLSIVNRAERGIASGYYNGVIDVSATLVYVPGFDAGMLLESYVDIATGESGSTYTFTDRRYTSNAIIGNGMGIGPLSGSKYFIQQGIPYAGTVSTTIVEHVVEEPSYADTGTDVSVTAEPTDPSDPDAPVADLTFDEVTTPGNVTIAPIPTPAPPANFTILGGQSYDINSSAEFSGYVNVCLSYDEADLLPGMNEQFLRLLHFNGFNWEDVTSVGSINNPNPDTVNNSICGLTDSLSPFAIGGQEEVVVTPPPSTSTGVPIMNGWWILAALGGGVALLRRRSKLN